MAPGKLDAVPSELVAVLGDVDQPEIAADLAKSKSRLVDRIEDMNAKMPAIELVYLFDHKGMPFCRSCLSYLAEQDEMNLLPRVLSTPNMSFLEGPEVCSNCSRLTTVLIVN